MANFRESQTFLVAKTAALRVLRQRWFKAIAAALAVYSLLGFLIVPFLVQRYAPAIASEKLHRQVSVGKVRFNPLLFKLEIEDFSLKEPDGQVMASVGRLFADLELDGLFRRAVALRRIRVEKLFVRPEIGSDGRLNFARLADAFPPSAEPEPPPEDSTLPRLLIDRFALVDGAVEFSDLSRTEPFQERVDPINLRLDDISTLPDNQARHHVTAALADGSVFDWHGQLSLSPLASDGDLRLDGFKLATPWPFVRDRVALAPPEGQLGFAANYRFRQQGDAVELALSEIGITLSGLRLLPAGSTDPILAFETIGMQHGRFDLAQQALTIPEFTIQKGTLKAAVNERGELDWLGLAKPSPVPPATAPAAAPTPTPTTPGSDVAKPWRVDIDAFKLSELALQLTDASRRIPIDFRVGAFGLGLKLGLEAGAGDPKLLVQGMASEIRKLALTPIGGKDPMLALDSFRFSDGEFDLSKKTLKLPLVVTSTGSVRAEVDEAGKMNWQKVAEAASPGATASPSPKAAKPVATKRVRKSTQKKAPPAEVPPAEAPWRIGVDRLQIEKIGFRYADDSRWSPIQVDIANFGLSLHADLEAGGPQPKGIIDGMQSEVRQIVLRERQREAPLASLDAFIVNGGRIDLGKNAIGIDRVDLNGGAAAIERDEKGAIRLARVFAPKDEGKLRQVVREVETAAEAEGKPWQIALSQINLGGFRAGFSDRSVSPAASFEVRPADLHLKDVANFGKTPISFNGKLRLVQGGDLSLQGQAAPSGERGQADIRLDRLNLVGLQPYVAQVGSLKLESGNVSTQMKVGFQQKSGTMSLTAKGEVGSAELLLKEAKTGKRFVAWDRLKVDGIDFSMAPDKLAIKEIHAIKPGANVEIFEDRTTNINAIFAPKKAVANAGPAPAAKPTAPSEKKVAGKPFPFSVQRVKVDEAILDFSDASLVLPFKTRIQNFGGTISGISNTPSSRTLLKLDGRVDEYGEANLEGTLDLMQHNAFSDVSLIFRNVEMSSLSPYSGTFAGRRIQSGKLNAELRYKIENSNLNSHGKIELDQLALGEEVVSPKAKSLPLDLAVALLTDNAGKITVSVPIEGNVNNPQFDYGSVIWDAIVTLITKAVTAPFTVLAGVFGSGDQDVGEIFFIPGKNGLPPAEIEKLKKVGSGLGSRPNVVLKVSGTFDPKLDAKALKSWDVRTQVTEKLGIGVAPGEDPGPVAFDNAKAQKALEDLAEERGGNDIVAAALTAFRQQAGREPKRVGAMASWMDKASEDASFYQGLFDQLVETAPLAPNALEALADRRSQAVLKELSVTKGLDRSRLRVEKAVATSDKDGRIPTKLDLAAGGA